MRKLKGKGLIKFVKKVEPKLKIDNKYSTYAVEVDMVDSTWRYTFVFALGYFLMPFLVILSKLTKRKVKFGYEEWE